MSGQEEWTPRTRRQAKAVSQDLLLATANNGCKGVCSRVCIHTIEMSSGCRICLRDLLRKAPGKRNSQPLTDSERLQSLSHVRRFGAISPKSFLIDRQCAAQVLPRGGRLP